VAGFKVITEGYSHFAPLTVEDEFEMGGSTLRSLSG
jgi:hypothetical protein